MNDLPAAGRYLTVTFFHVSGVPTTVQMKIDPTMSRYSCVDRRTTMSLRSRQHDPEHDARADVCNVQLARLIDAEG